MALVAEENLFPVRLVADGLASYRSNVTKYDEATVRGR